MTFFVPPILIKSLIIEFDDHCNIQWPHLKILKFITYSKTLLQKDHVHRFLGTDISFGGYNSTNYTDRLRRTNIQDHKPPYPIAVLSFNFYQPWEKLYLCSSFIITLVESISKAYIWSSNDRQLKTRSCRNKGLEPQRINFPNSFPLRGAQQNFCSD